MRGCLKRMSICSTGRKKKAIGLLASCLFLITLSGCGQRFADKNTLAFNKDGSITEYMAEEFDTAIYDMDEWEAQVKSEIENYNSERGKSEVKLLGAKHEGGILKCTVQYASDNAYFDLNKLPLFYGTVEQAINAGYSLMTPVKDVQTGEKLSPSVLQGMKEKHIVILKYDTDVSTYKKITHISEGVIWGEDYKTATVSSESTAYIVFD